MNRTPMTKAILRVIARAAALVTETSVVEKLRISRMISILRAFLSARTTDPDHLGKAAQMMSGF
jgi:hypothetical protein